MSPLSQLHSDIDARVATIRADRPDWLCGKGCDSCCRRLAEVPQLSAAEWHLLRGALAALGTEQRREIGHRMTALAGQTTRPVVCPLLEQSTGHCPVYAQRPVACRSYGYYVQRELGLYCAEIEARVAAGALADVVWGNHDAVDSRLAGFGEGRALTEWYAEWPERT